MPAARRHTIQRDEACSEFRDCDLLRPSDGVLHRHRQRLSLAGNQESRRKAVSGALRPRAPHRKSLNLHSRRIPRTFERLLRRDLGLPGIVSRRLQISSKARRARAKAKPRSATDRAVRQGSCGGSSCNQKGARSPEKGSNFLRLQARGIQDNTVDRLLLMSSSEKHLPSVPMAFFIEERPTDERNVIAPHVAPRATA